LAYLLKEKNFNPPSSPFIKGEARGFKEEENMEQGKRVDGFRFLPPGLTAWVRKFIPDEEFKGFIPWTPMAKPLSQTTFALVTSAGISLKKDPPFDMEREKKEIFWGDRSYRIIPRGTDANDIDVNHLHINTKYIRQDINVMLPLARMAEFEQEGIIGHLAPSSYSFYGYQWENNDFLKEAIEPISEMMKLEGVKAVLMTPA
jgi:D-proline reductase (dithiol) PrdB